MSHDLIYEGINCLQLIKFLHPDPVSVNYSRGIRKRCIWPYKIYLQLWLTLNRNWSLHIVLLLVEWTRIICLSSFTIFVCSNPMRITKKWKMYLHFNEVYPTLITSETELKVPKSLSVLERLVYKHARKNKL